MHDSATRVQRGGSCLAIKGSDTHQRGVAKVLGEQGSCRIVHCEIGVLTVARWT